MLELRLVLDLLGEQRHAVFPAALEQFGNLVRLHQGEVDLDDGGHLEDAFGAVEPREVVQGEGEALVEQPLAALDDLVVDHDRLEHFDHRALRRQHNGDVAHQHAPTGVAEDESVAGQAVHPDLDRIEEDLGRHEVTLEVVLGLARRERVLGRPEEELVADDVEPFVEDRLARDDQLRARCRNGALAQIHHLVASCCFVLPLVTTGGVLSCSSRDAA